MGCRSAALVALLAAAAVAGCVGQARPNEVTPLEVVEWPERETRVVGYELAEILVATPFGEPWDAAVGEDALRDLGFEPGPEGAWVQGDDVAAVVAPTADGDGFWLNLTYDGFGAARAPSLAEAQALAEPAWESREWLFLAQMGAFVERTGWEPSARSERTDTFRALLG